MSRYDNVQTSFFDFDELWDRLIPQDSIYRLFHELAPILVTPQGNKKKSLKLRPLKHPF